MIIKKLYKKVKIHNLLQKYWKYIIYLPTNVWLLNGNKLFNSKSKLLTKY